MLELQRETIVRCNETRLSASFVSVSKVKRYWVDQGFTLGETMARKTVTPAPRRRKLILLSAVALLSVGGLVSAQEPTPAPQDPSAAEPQQPQQPLLSAQQLDDLVAPVALYPDPILGQLLAASTYPLELVEAQQWMQHNPGLTGQALVDAARQQNWDPSVQALVVFPDVLNRLTSDIRWTTDIGNAFLAQQPDVMASVQRMRARAQENGKLQSTPQQNVVTQDQNGQSAIGIQPANPDTVYIPYYNPEYIWGPPVYGFYPPLLYPGIDVGFGFGPGIGLGFYFGAGWGGWGGWGWGGWGWYPNWFGGGIYVNDRFFHRFGYRDFHGYARGGVQAWAHDPGHRLGVPYPNRQLAGRYQGAEFRGGERSGAQNFSGRGESANRENFGSERREQPSQRFGSQGFEQHNFGDSHSAFGGIHNGGQTRMESDHGSFSMGHAGGGGFGGGGRGGGGRR